MRRFLTVMAAAFLASAAVACKHDSSTDPGGSITAFLPSCPAGTGLFTSVPFATSQIAGWVPLGNLNPPGHTFPTDHQYIYLSSFLSGSNLPVPLYSPGDVTVLYAKSTRYSSGIVPEDYAVTFAPCREVGAEFGHVRTLSSTLLAALGPFNQNCQTYSPNPGLTVTQCYTKNVSVAVKSGEQIGTAAGLDLSLFDARIAPLTYANPARWVSNGSEFDHFHVVPFSDYYVEPMRTVVRSMLGSFDGRKRRTMEPLGGSIASDVAGTAQGSWLVPGQPTYPESPHLAIAPYNVDPTRTHISMGTSQPGFLSNEYYVSLATGANMNLNPAQVVPATGIVCYEFDNGYGVALLQLADATTLKFEGRNGASRTCAGEKPWTFTSAAVTYVR